MAGVAGADGTGPRAFRRDLGEGGVSRLGRRGVMPYREEYYVDQPARAQLWAWDGELVRGVRERRDGD